MTFDDWWDTGKFNYLRNNRYRKYSPIWYAYEAWTAAIESTKTKVEPLTEEQIDELFPFKGYYDKNTQRLDTTEGNDYVGPEDC